MRPPVLTARRPMAHVGSYPAASITTSAPSPFVASNTEAAGSSPVTGSAPCASARRSRSGTGSVTGTRDAPYRNAAFAISTPIGPAPITKTRSPLPTARDVTCTAFAIGSISVATSSETPAPSGTAADIGTTKHSANPPVRSRPTSCPAAHRLIAPSRHQRHVPQDTIGFKHHALADPR